MAIREKRSVARSLFSPGSRKFWKGICDQSRLLFIALIVNSDDEGRLEGEPDDIIATVPKMSLDEKAATKLLKELAKNELISWYDVDGLKYIQINKFDEFQSWNGIMRDPSKYPADPNGPKTVAQNGRSPSVAMVAEKTEKSATTAEVRDFNIKEFTSLNLGSSVSGQSEGLDSRSAFSNAKKLYRRYVGTSFGSLGNRAYQWDNLIKQHGSDLVLAAMEIYARELGKGGRNLGYPLAHFLKNVSEFIEAAQVKTEEIKVETASQDLELQMAAQIEKEREQDAFENLKKQAERQKEKDFNAKYADQI